MAKYIKKIKLGTGDALQIKDVEAVSSINGYTVDDTGSVVDDDNNEITFANKPITSTEIDEILSTLSTVN